MKRAFLFAGQGAQYTGMGKDLCEGYPAADRIFNMASESLGVDMKHLCFKGPDEELKKTENTQPTILTVDTAIAEVLKDKGVSADVTAGLSLGEYAALVYSGALNFDEAVQLVKKRGKFMQEAVPIGEGAMAAIVGLKRETVDEIIKEASEIGIVEGANYNYPGQIVISGETGAVEETRKLTQEKGGKAILLPVSAPFHCSMLKSAGEKLALELAHVEVSALQIPVLSNVTADFYTTERVKELLVKQVSHSVLWEDIISRMFDKGVDEFVEIGPGKALTGFVKKIARKTKKDIRCCNIEDANGLESFISGC